MADVIIPILIGITLGYLSGLGIGGGSLLILWLTSVIGMDPRTARVINLMYFILCAGSVSIFRLTKRTLEMKELLPGMIAGCISAAMFSWFSTYIDADLMKKLFGGLLVFTGIKELFYRPRKLR